MSTFLIVGLIIAFLILLAFYLRERSSNNINRALNDDLMEEQRRLIHVASNNKQDSDSFEGKLNLAVKKLKAFGFTGIDDTQLDDPVTIDKVSKVRSSLVKSSQLRLAEKQEREAEAERLKKEESDRLIQAQIELHQKRHQENQQAAYSSAYGSNGVYIASAVAYDYADNSGNGSFSSSGGSFSDSGSSSSDGGGGGGGGD